MLDRVATQYCGLVKEKPVLVGVSGGPDSLCLLHSLKTLGFSVIASHVNHQTLLRAVGSPISISSSGCARFLIKEQTFA
jgi:tRNA U34 2-thiouridine synthase MnmA/TrmU